MKPASTNPSRPDASRDTPFSMEIENRGEAAIVTLRGSCTMNVATNVGERLKSLASGGHRILVLDLKDLDFIESTGLGGIVAGYLRARMKDGEVRIASPPKAILRLLELTRLTQLFPVYDSVEAALR